MNRRLLLGSITLALISHAYAGDSAANYSTSNSAINRWMSNGHRGDVNQGVWSFESGANGGSVGRFIGSSGLDGMGDINTDGKCFAIFANPPTNSPFYAARKTFAKPTLTTGDTITFQVVVNFRNGFKGFNLRNTSDTSVWTFNVGRVDGTSGYYIRNGPSASVSNDNGQRFGGYHANSVFTFTFTQRERVMDWTVVRSGGISATVSGSAPIESGTMGTVRFFISGTDAGGLPANNLYFNNFTFETESRGDAPLTIGERRMPGHTPSHILRFADPSATSVTVRTSNDGFSQSFPLTKTHDVWEIDIRELELPPGWHNFKFRINSQWESDPNRRLYLDADGRIALPPAVYLTWAQDPTTTMVVHWHNNDPQANTLRHRPAGSSDPWTTLEANHTGPFPYTERQIHTAEITSLAPASEHEFEVDGYLETFRFRTLPSNLDTPLRFGIGGDVDVGPIPDAMTAAISSHDPAFLVVGGDVAYADGRAENFWKWMRYFESWFHNARAPDGRLIPTIMAAGNHEVRYGYAENHPDFEDTTDWRLRYAPYFYRLFAFPGETGHNVLDAGDYLSLVILDTDHTNRIDNQNAWLTTTLNARRDRKHLIPVYHVPAYTTFRSFNDPQSVRVRQHWVPIFEQAGVKLAFEHHDHTFKRTKPILAGAENPNGIRYIGDGLWGIGKRTPDPSRWYLDITNDNHHVHLVTLTATDRSVIAVDTQGEFFGGEITQPIDGIPESPNGLAATRIRARAARIAWQPVANATSYQIERDGEIIATTTAATYFDNSRIPESTTSYRVLAVNRSGISEPSPAIEISTPSESIPPFPIGTPNGLPGYLLASPGMSLYAAVRGDDLYLATWSPTGGANDHFIFMTDELPEAAIHQAPWRKTGLVAHPRDKPILAAESEIDYIEWRNAPDGSVAARGNQPGSLMEGVIDLVDTFGNLPNQIHIAATAYATQDGGALVGQAPEGDGDANVDPNEFLTIPLDAIRDTTGTAMFDRMQPAHGLRAEAAGPPGPQGFTIRWRAIPGRRYQLWRSTDLSSEGWSPVLTQPMIAPSGTDIMEFTDSHSSNLPRAFYRVEAVDMR